MNNKRVITIAPMPPEKCAYALARYSRSPDNIEQSIRWVFDHSPEKFWEKFYFDYGHGSIADLGHIVICFENISELAAIAIEDEPLWNGQAKSSRYQDFSRDGYFIPDKFQDKKAEELYNRTARNLADFYNSIFDPINQYLREQNPKPEQMKVSAYERNVQARTFDVTRYVLTLASKTNIGQIVSIRTLEKQINNLLSSKYPELIEIGDRLKAACHERPVDIWGELSNSKISADPLAPTLSRFVKPNEYPEKVYAELNQVAKELLSFDSIEEVESVELIDAHPPLDEIVTTLLYKVSHYPYQQILNHVQTLSDEQKQKIIEPAFRIRDKWDMLTKEFNSGYTFIFDILMDIGGWRDMHRHRRCQQIMQEFTGLHGYEIPQAIIDAGQKNDYCSALDEAAKNIQEIQKYDWIAGTYLIPFAFKVRCLFKMDYAEAEYISKLRSGVKGHISYRTVAWKMKEKVQEKYPILGEKIEATHFSVEDVLKR